MPPKLEQMSVIINIPSQPQRVASFRACFRLSTVHLAALLDLLTKAHDDEPR